MSQQWDSFPQRTTLLQHIMLLLRNDVPVYSANYKAAAIRHPCAGGDVLVLVLLIHLVAVPRVCVPQAYLHQSPITCPKCCLPADNRNRHHTDYAVFQRTKHTPLLQVKAGVTADTPPAEIACTSLSAPHVRMRLSSGLQVRKATAFSCPASVCMRMGSPSESTRQIRAVVSLEADASIVPL